MIAPTATKPPPFADEGFPREHVRARHYSLNWRMIDEKDAGVRSYEHSAEDNSIGSEILLLKDLARLRMNLLVLDLAGIPTSTQRLHQIDGTDHLLSEQLRLQAFVIEKRGLRGDDIQIACNSPHI